MATKVVNHDLGGGRVVNGGRVSGVIAASKYTSGDILVFPQLNEASLDFFRAVVDHSTPVDVEIIKGADLSTIVDVHIANAGVEVPIRYVGFYAGRGLGDTSPTNSQLRLRVHCGSQAP